METTAHYKRIEVLGVPLDILPEESLMSVLEQKMGDGGSHQIMFLKFADFMKARKKGEFREAVMNASLVLPLSRRLMRAASFLKEDKPVMYKPFDLIIRIFGLVERKGKSAYLLGSSKKKMQISHRNLKDSFPGLNFVGRYHGYYDKSIEKDILLAIRKASPSFLLAGKGLKGKNLWLYRNRKDFNPSLMLWDKHCYEIFAGKRRKPSYSGFNQFMTGFFKALIMPWRILLIFRFFYYLILLLAGRVRKNKSLKEKSSEA